VLSHVDVVARETRLLRLGDFLVGLDHRNHTEELGLEVFYNPSILFLDLSEFHKNFVDDIATNVVDTVRDVSDECVGRHI
jgi:hypothetical protein